MIKRYDNIHASDSVAVMSLKGHLLGYVPRRHSARFVHDTNFGHVYAIGQDAASLWRLTVSLCVSCVLSVCLATMCECHAVWRSVLLHVMQ